MFVVFHNAAQNGDLYAVPQELVQNVHVEANGSVRVVVEYPGGTTYSLDVTESFQDVVDALNS